ncbi:helix-turn-helix domain-containing protein [Stappia indica]|uniref:helix-turn-helix domain-containing protein n=1 Tax=Stappia indica TaxID=538381 RepID=UPI001CD61F6A|nr:helix-turn-helix domain-containing protein [Stappia indica]MCA1298496.1 helix-turn-helix domain-containing protein [Stappia indica]
MNRVTSLKDRGRKPATYRIQYSDKANWMMALGIDQRLTPAEMRIGIVLCGYINARSGRAWPTVPTLAEATGTSDSSAKRAIRKLEKVGLISVHRKGGRGHPNYYELRFDRLVDTAEKGVTGEPFCSEKGASNEPKGVQNHPVKGFTGDPQIEKKEIKKTRAHTREEHPRPESPAPAQGESGTDNASPAPSSPPSSAEQAGRQRAEFVPRSDPRWDRLSEVYHQRKGKPPMTIRLHGEKGWLFPVDVLDALEDCQRLGPS